MVIIEDVSAYVTEKRVQTLMANEPMYIKKIGVTSKHDKYVTTIRLQT